MFTPFGVDFACQEQFHKHASYQLAYKKVSNISTGVAEGLVYDNC